jgi:hypothetical protein
MTQPGGPRRGAVTPRQGVANGPPAEGQSVTHSPYHGAEEIRMSTFFPHDLPQPDTIDHAAAMRAARWEACKQRLNWAVIADEFVGQLKARLQCRHHPLAAVVVDLKDSPLEDHFELDGWLQTFAACDKARLGEAVLRLLGEAQLHVLSQLDERPF